MSPENIRVAGVKMVQARKQLDKAKLQEKAAVANVIVKNTDAKNQKVLDAIIDNDDVVIAQRLVIIEAQAEYEIAKINHEHQNDLFTSARKIGGMDEKELRAISGSVIYKKET